MEHKGRKVFDQEKRKGHIKKERCWKREGNDKPKCINFTTIIVIEIIYCPKQNYIDASHDIICIIYYQLAYQCQIVNQLSGSRFKKELP